MKFIATRIVEILLMNLTRLWLKVSSFAYEEDIRLTASTRSAQQERHSIKSIARDKGEWFPLFKTYFPTLTLTLQNSSVRALQGFRVTCDRHCFPLYYFLMVRESSACLHRFEAFKSWSIPKLMKRHVALSASASFNFWKRLESEDYLEEGFFNLITHSLTQSSKL